MLTKHRGWKDNFDCEDLITIINKIIYARKKTKSEDAYFYVFILIVVKNFFSFIKM